jgi:small subunit ribosomal protein S6
MVLPGGAIIEAPFFLLLTAIKGEIHRKEVTGMRDYELAFIIRPNVEAEDVTGAVDKVTQLVEAVNGEVTSIDVWGRRELAYLINDYREGTYVLLQTKMPPSSVIELERDLKLSEDIIRYLLVKVES